MKKIFKFCTVLLSSLLILTACSSEKTKVYTAKGKNEDVVLTSEINYDELDFEKYRERVHLSDSDTLENERKLSTVEDNLKKEGATEQK